VSTIEITQRKRYAYQRSRWQTLAVMINRFTPTPAACCFNGQDITSLQ
jgi:hypothetical protein